MVIIVTLNELLKYFKYFSVIISNMVNIDRSKPHTQKPFGVLNNFKN